MFPWAIIYFRNAFVMSEKVENAVFTFSPARDIEFNLTPFHQEKRLWIWTDIPDFQPLPKN